MTLLTTTYDPATHKIVPLQPTEEMIEALSRGVHEDKRSIDVVIDVVNAAPSIPSVHRSFAAKSQDWADGWKAGRSSNAPAAPSGWISVEDALPEENTDVLFYGSGRQICGVYNNGEFWDNVAGRAHSTYYWCELPAPPAPKETA